MGRKNNRARSGFYSERLLQPNIGAKHPIVDGDNFGFFMSEVRYALDETIPPQVDIKDDRIRRKSRFLMYDDIDRVGISILEQRLARTHAQRNRIRWSKHDIGRIQGEIQNEIGRLELSGQRLEVTFDSVVRLGDADEKKARKLALVPEQDSVVSEFFCNEHEIAINGLSGSMRRFRYPYSGEWIPHLTVGRVFKEVPHEHLSEAVRTVKRFLPLTLEIEPIKFVSQQEIPSDAVFFDEWEETGE